MAPSFSPKTVSFLRALERNNNREWFNQHRADYDAHARGPLIAIVEQLAKDFRSFAPELVADPKVSLFKRGGTRASARTRRRSRPTSPLSFQIARSDG